VIPRIKDLLSRGKKYDQVNRELIKFAGIPEDKIKSYKNVQSEIESEVKTIVAAFEKPFINE